MKPPLRIGQINDREKERELLSCSSAVPFGSLLGYHRPKMIETIQPMKMRVLNGTLLIQNLDGDHFRPL